jgi:hypothetical protein
MHYLPLQIDGHLQIIFQERNRLFHTRKEKGIGSRLWWIRIHFLIQILPLRMQQLHWRNSCQKLLCRLQRFLPGDQLDVCSHLLITFQLRIIKQLACDSIHCDPFVLGLFFPLAPIGSPCQTATLKGQLMIRKQIRQLVSLQIDWQWLRECNGLCFRELYCLFGGCKHNISPGPVHSRSKRIKTPKYPRQYGRLPQLCKSHSPPHFPIISLFSHYSLCSRKRESSSLGRA